MAAATTLDGPVLNAPETMAVNFAVADGDSFVLFASDYLGTEFVVGNTLTLTVTFADGSTATGGDYSALARTMHESVFLGVRLPSP